ncbi:MAG: SMP-30/gluconolactonase/LRE family protein [Planctomycetota bacterium]
MSVRRTIAQALAFDQDAKLKFLPEGPFPLGKNRISWVAIQHGADETEGSLNILDLSTGTNRSFPLPGRPGFAFPTDREDVFVIGLERQLGMFNIQDQSWSPFCDGVDSDVSGTIINDGIALGSHLIFGTKDLEFKTTKAGLYLFRGTDQKLIRLRNDQLCSNGKAILAADDDHVVFLDIDSPTRKVVRYTLDMAAGTLSTPQTVIDFAGDPAVPDGQTLCPDGKSTVVSMFRPEVAAFGEARRYDLETGECIEIWETPGSPQNTCPQWVQGDRGVDLVMTTAIENFTAAQQAECPAAGQLFVAPTEFQSLPDAVLHRFPVGS